jgi:glucose 1-dehydrogenase
VTGECAQGGNVPNRLQGKVTAITGGHQGIGLGIAERFVKEGADVSICYRADQSSAERAAEGLRELHEGGGKVVAIQADVSKIAEGARYISETVSQLGGLDILVNNAGVERRGNFWEVSEADYDFVMNVNLKGLFFMTQAAVRHWMQAKRPGKIINISSVHEELPFPHFSSYCASKGGLKMLTRNLSIELAPYNITINNIAPGAIETPINKNLLKRSDEIGEPAGEYSAAAAGHAGRCGCGCSIFGGGGIKLCDGDDVCG